MAIVTVFGFVGDHFSPTTIHEHLKKKMLCRNL